MGGDRIPAGIEAASLARGARLRERMWRDLADKATTSDKRARCLDYADDYAVFAAELEEQGAHDTEEHESIMQRLARRIALTRH